MHVIPAKAGIQCFSVTSLYDRADARSLDSRFRGNDGYGWGNNEFLDFGGWLGMMPGNS
jgi:hypothetical protein